MRKVTIYTASIHKAGYGVWFGENDPRNKSGVVCDIFAHHNAELMAIDKALNVVLDLLVNTRHSNFEITTNSTPILNCLLGKYIDWKKEPTTAFDKHDWYLLRKCHNKIERVNRTGTIIFNYKSSHESIGIRMARRLARRKLNFGL
ncbi:hypothetical protein DAMA08_021980 [Martiniozyma asiatica (nom. inval.)]|nr:hypothetical protein DAMA08_021980 [Martiniozyma asiatica]